MSRTLFTSFYRAPPFFITQIFLLTPGLPRGDGGRTIRPAHYHFRKSEVIIIITKRNPSFCHFMNMILLVLGWSNGTVLWDPQEGVDDTNRRYGKYWNADSSMLVKTKWVFCRLKWLKTFLYLLYIPVVETTEKLSNSILRRIHQMNNTNVFL